MLKKVLFISNFFVFFCALADEGPLVVAVLMVKNESVSIVKTLQPLVMGGVADFVIFDTGSTDGTQKKVFDFFAQYPICKTHILEESFVDFATSRNRALEYAGKKFPHATFMLMPDAEWFLHNTSQLLDFCKSIKNDTEPAYLIRITDEQTEFFTARLLRCSKRPRYVGAVHEQLDQKTRLKAPKDIFFEWAPSKKGSEQTAQRWQRDLKLLQKSFQKNPKDPRTVFFLAQTYAALGDTENACKYYLKRAKMAGYDEEDYLARYRLGFLSTDWSVALQWFLEAHNCRPERAEPLVCIAAHYYHEKNMPLCYLFAQRACEIPYPEDFFCVEKYLYDFARYDLLGASAIAVGQLGKGEWAITKALAYAPDMPHLQHNIKLYKNSRAL